jgi:hypothetical protein
MTKAQIEIEDVLSYLRPNGGWVIWGQDFNTIRYDEGVKPITEDELAKGFSEYAAWKITQDAAKESQRQAILDRLGLTEEEAKLLLG